MPVQRPGWLQPVRMVKCDIRETMTEAD